VYICIGLATDSQKGIAELVQRIWSISNNGDTDDEKFSLIKSFLEINVNKWDKYWQMYQEIVNGCKKKSALGRYLMKIPTGTLSLIQYIWILTYMAYGVFAPTLALSEGIHFLVDLGGLSFFLYTSGRVIGVGDFMINIFEAMKPTEKSVKASLQLLESEIIFGAQHYGFLKNKIDLKLKR
jgi:hypothetical protein